jgi:hypothetical protein
MMKRFEAVEGHGKENPRASAIAVASGESARSSPRQLPTNHDHDGGLNSRPANISVINRRVRPSAALNCP